jgi:ABC-type transport system involved in multi-copper enzyme maturation permease subunit
MNLPIALRTIRWLAWDTFRQALASGIFWLMLGISVICTLFCLSTGVEGGATLHRPGELTEFLPRNDPQAKQTTQAAKHGVDVVEGRLTLAFGAIRLPLGRDTDDAVRLLQLMLAGGVADALGLLLALVWTAGFLPSFLEPSAASVLLAKPVSRWWLLAGKYLGVLAFVAAQAMVFVGGTWFALGIATGVWVPEYWLCVPLLLLHFAVMYSVSALLAVCTRGTVACVFGSIVFWLMCWGTNYGRHMLVALSTPGAELDAFAGPFRGLVEIIYWVLPKPADLAMLLQGALQASDHFAAIPAFETVRQQGAFSPEASVLSSLVFAVAVLAVAARRLATTDY